MLIRITNNAAEEAKEDLPKNLSTFQKYDYSVTKKNGNKAERLVKIILNHR